MAAIGTIRKYSGIAIGLIGVSILAFVVSDAFQTNSALLGNKKMMIGEVDGERISYQQFQNRFDVELDKYMKRMAKESVDEATRNQLRDELWQKINDEIIYGKEFEYTGINFSSEELTFHVTGPNPHPAVKQFFTNPETQEFDRNNLINFLKNIDQYPEYKEIWLDFELELAKEKKREKYFTLIKQGMYMTNLEAKNVYFAKNQYATFEYVAVPYKDVQDSSIKVTDEDLKKYYDKHKEEHKIEETRSFDYVVFDVMPTKEDSLALFNLLLNIRKEFRDATNDSLYVEVNSDEAFDTNFRNPGYFYESIDHVYFDLKNDDSIIGPFLDKGYYKMAKLVEKKQDTVFYYKASHILIKAEGPTEEDTLRALKRARELMADAKAGKEEFSIMAMRNSEDKGTAIKGGDLGWFADGSMVKPFMDAVKKMKSGEYAVVRSQFGAHLIHLTGEKSNTLIKVGVIAKRIDPSAETYQQQYAKAIKFRSHIKNADDFEFQIKEKGYDKRLAQDIRPDQKELPGLISGRIMINWAYRSKMDDISDVIAVDNSFIVAHLTEVYEKGIAPFEKVKEMLNQFVVKEKKEQMLLEKFNNANKAGNSLIEIAKILNKPVDKVTNASFDMPFISNIGEEKLLIGMVFGAEKDQLSDPVIGQNAVFQFVLKDFSKVEEPKDFTEIKKERLSTSQGMSQYTSMEALKELADVKDLRYKFF